MCQSVNLIYLDDATDIDFKHEYFRYFGTPSKSLWTMFEITFSGGWQKHARPLVEEVSPLWAVFFFVALASQDAESTIRDKMKEKACSADELVAISAEADRSSDGASRG